MPNAEKEEGRILRAEIHDLSESAAKQALYGMVEILEQHPSVLLAVFREFMTDAWKMSEAQRGQGLRKVV